MSTIIANSVRIFEYHDIPLVFTAKHEGNTYETTFLYMNIGEASYLYTRIEPHQLVDLQRGTITLRGFFLTAPVIFRTSLEGEKNYIEEELNGLTLEQQEKWLPEKDYVFDIGKDLNNQEPPKEPHPLDFLYQHVELHCPHGARHDGRLAYSGTKDRYFTVDDDGQPIIYFAKDEVERLVKGIKPQIHLKAKE